MHIKKELTALTVSPYTLYLNKLQRRSLIVIITYKERTPHILKRYTRVLYIIIIIPKIPSHQNVSA